MSAARAGTSEERGRPAVLSGYRAFVPGFALAVGLALVAQVVEAAERAWLGRPYLESIILALLFGVALRNLPFDLKPFEKGAAYVANQVLECAVVLLGAGIVASDLVAAGAGLAAVIILGVAGALIVGFLAGRSLGLGWRLALLVATGTAICGNSSIAAVAPVIDAEEEGSRVPSP